MLGTTRKSTLLLSLLISLISAAAPAGPISMSGGYWSIQFGDTDAMCGTHCSTDVTELAIWEQYDIRGTHGMSHSRQSGGASASFSAFGTGTEWETDNAYGFQLDVERSVFARVAADAPSNAWANGRVALSGRFGFILTETALYTGTPFGSILNGMTLGPGTYEWFIGDVLGGGSGLGTNTVRAGQEVSATIAASFVFRVESVSVPEPGTLALLSMGLLGITLARRRRW